MICVVAMVGHPPPGMPDTPCSDDVRNVELVNASTGERMVRSMCETHIRMFEELPEHQALRDATDTFLS